MPRTITVPDWAPAASKLQSLALVATICVVAWLVQQRQAAPVVPPRPAPVTPADPRPSPGPVQPPGPGSTSVLVHAAAGARGNFGPSFASVGERIRSGELKTSAAILEALAENTAEFNSSLRSAIGDRCTPSGDVNDAEGLADVFAGMGKAFPAGSGAK
jgi:hypothetical protein